MKGNEIMDTVRICQQCSKPLPPDAPEGLCPECLMKGALASNASTKVGGESSSRPSTPPPSPTDLAPHFPQLEILELLGQGGMGVVYKARQRQLDRLVALKILPVDSGRDPAFAERFTREARALARLNHPNIVSVYDFGQSGGYFYFVMEFMDGGNVRDVISARTLAPREALAIVPRICDALQYAHDEGIMHRDIKPENILLDRKGRVKIADFGLAKLMGREPANLSLTATGSLVGTPRYMAPEQFERPAEVDHRADIYSLGVVFYEMLTGELPMGRFAPPSQKVEVDVRLDEVVLHTLEKEPSRRYQHASEVKTDVESISTSAAPPHVAPPPRSVPAEDAATLLARRQVRGPAIGLIVTSLVNWLALFVAVLFMSYAMSVAAPRMPVQPGGGHRVAATAVLPLVFVILTAGSGLILWGALRMLRLESPGLARLASILAMIIGPGYLVGWPVGIWSLVVLSRREVKEAFNRRHGLDKGSPAGSNVPRFSRKAIVGAVWAIGVLAIPAFIMPMSVTSYAATEGGGAPDAGPGLLQLVLAVALLVAGATAPFATTILGVLALHDIRHSRGQIAGLPLAFADALVFPLLLLNGALVGVGALIVTLAWSILGAMGVHLPPFGGWEMLIFGGAIGLLAGAPLSWFLVRKAWIAAHRPVDATPASPSVPPPQPASAPLPPEPGATRRRLWLWFGAAAGVVAIIALGAALTRPDNSIRIQEDDQARASAGKDLFFPYAVQAPANHRVSFWIEAWTNGVRAEIPGLRLAESHDPARGDRFKGGVQLDLSQRLPGSQPGGLHWSWTVKKRFSRASKSSVCDDPLQRMRIIESTWGHVRRWTPKAGEIVTLVRVRGAREQADVAIELKARIDPVPVNELKNSPASGSFSPPVADRPTAEAEAR